MLDALFGTDLSPVAKVIVGLMIFGVLVAIFILVMRRFGGTFGATASPRGRQPRLGITEFASLGDGRRRLVLVRRDNVEHLVMIGGPSDVVIEPNLVRATPAASAREVAPARVSGPIADTLPRPVPLADGGNWPLQPEPMMRPQRPTPAPPPPVVAAAGDADDEEADWTPEPTPAPAPRPADVAPRPANANADRVSSLGGDLTRGFRDNEPIAPPRRVTDPRRTPPQPAPAITESEEQNLAEMAQRLETALQRPRPAAAEPAPVAPAVAAAPAARSAGVAPVAVTVQAEPKQVRVEPKVVRAEPKPAPKPAPKAAFDSLEQEMASLLGRPSGKT